MRAAMLLSVQYAMRKMTGHPRTEETIREFNYRVG